MRSVEEKAQCFHYLHGIDILGADQDGQLLFACIHPDRQKLHANAPLMLKEMMGEMSRVDHPFFTFWTPDSCLFHVLTIRIESEKFILLLGPIGLTSPESTYDKLIPSKNRKELEYLGRLFYWLFVKEVSGIPRPVTYTITNTPSFHVIPEISLVNLYYEQEPVHITLEEYKRLKEKCRQAMPPLFKVIWTPCPASKKASTVSSLLAEMFFDQPKIISSPPVRSYAKLRWKAV